jgi:hypothetical protein
VASTGVTTGVSAPASPRAPSGGVVVAVPDPVVTWWGEDSHDLAAGDLAALWALPLHRVDPRGRLVPALAIDVAMADGADGWAVDVTLAEGDWSDGRPVVAADVVATVEALTAARPATWSLLVEASVVGERIVRLRFARPYPGWPWLFVGAPGVLPAHVLAEQGLAGWLDDVPVSGGPYRLVEDEREVEQRWVAHPTGPLGPPGLAEVRTLVVPDPDLALGLLDDGTVDVVLGHVALDPAGRAAAVAGIEVATPIGGTSLDLVRVAPQSAGGPGGPAWADAVASLTVAPFVGGLLREAGAPGGGLLPGTIGVSRIDAPGPALPAGTDVRLLVPSTVGPLALLARLVRRDLTDEGAEVSVVRVAPPAHLGEPLDADVRLLVGRRWPVPSAAGALASIGVDIGLGQRADAEGPGGVVAGGTPTVAPPSWRTVDEVIAADGGLRRLAAVAPLQAWAPDRVVGVSAADWPGLALWDVASWRVP